MDEYITIHSSMEIVYAEYINQWQDLFFVENYYQKLIEKGRNGSLEEFYFRSVCWKRLLNYLPEDTAEWEGEAFKRRLHYEMISKQFEMNPRNTNNNKVTSMDHPLSQSDKSPWYVYFQNTELKASIEQDVTRTYPEVLFFRSSEVQEIMIKILFNYARVFPEIGYHQGMHELLAPIIYVLYTDQDVFVKLSSVQELPLIMCDVLNGKYIEHDAFILFTHLMEIVEDWYTYIEAPMKCISREPFKQILSTHYSNKLGITLSRIYRKHLCHHDPTLHSHLVEMQIVPEIFGIRWLRLLFGREFEFPNFLIIWDAIISSKSTSDFIEYIFTAMLIHIREILLKSDYNTCLSIMMHYPDNNCSKEIVEKAIYLKEQESCNTPNSNLNKSIIKSMPSPTHLDIETQRTENLNNNTQPNYHILENSQLSNNSWTSSNHVKKSQSTKSKISSFFAPGFARRKKLNQNLSNTQILHQKQENGLSSQIKEKEMQIITKSSQKLSTAEVNEKDELPVCDLGIKEKLQFCSDTMLLHLDTLSILNPENKEDYYEYHNAFSGLKEIHIILKQILASMNSIESSKHEIANDILHELENNIKKIK